MRPKTGRVFDAEAFLNSPGLDKRRTDYAPAGEVFAQGDPADSVLYIQRGSVKLSVLSQTGREAVVGILSSGDFFGEGALAGQAVRLATATSMDATAILVIPKRQMIRLLHQQHALSDRFIAHMLARNRRLEEDLVDQLFNASEKRLARTLLLLARYGKPDGPRRVLPPSLTQALAPALGGCLGSSARISTDTRGRGVSLGASPAYAEAGLKRAVMPAGHDRRAERRSREGHVRGLRLCRASARRSTNHSHEELALRADREVGRAEEEADAGRPARAASGELERCAEAVHGDEAELSHRRGVAGSGDEHGAEPAEGGLARVPVAKRQQRVHRAARRRPLASDPAPGRTRRVAGRGERLGEPANVMRRHEEARLVRADRIATTGHVGGDDRCRPDGDRT